MATQPMLINLSHIWNQTIEAGKILSQVVDPQTSHTIEIGLAREPGSGTVQFYGTDLTSSTKIAKRVERRAVAGSTYYIQVNEFRALRPRVGSEGCPFVCDPRVSPLPRQSLWARELLFLVSLTDSTYCGFANLVPFSELGHFVIVPCRIECGNLALPHSPQLLSHQRVLDFLRLRRLGDNTIFFFNPAGGGASVETHFHFQAVAYGGPLAIECAAREARGKYTLLSGYPANGLVFEGCQSDDDIWACIERFQTAGVPANLISIGDTVYVMPRSADAEGYPTGAPASMEMCGDFITADTKIYDTADQGLLHRVLRRATLAAEQMIAILGI